MKTQKEVRLDDSYQYLIRDIHCSDLSPLFTNTGAFPSNLSVWPLYCFGTALVVSHRYWYLPLNYASPTFVAVGVG